MKATDAKPVFAAYACVIAFVSLPAGGALVGSYDKSAHLLIYAIFAILAYRLGLTGRRFFYICIGIIAYSGLLEVGQSFVPGREMSALDLLANALGVLLGVLISRVVVKRA
jgi:VanZ family protein